MEGLVEAGWPGALQLQSHSGADVFLAASGPPKADTVLGLPAWSVAVIARSVGCLFTVTGLALQKQAAVAPGSRKVGSMSLSKRWFCGLLLGVLAPFPLQMCAYSIAPMSLTAPLSGSMVLLNMIVAPLLLGESVHRWPDVPAGMLILVGTVATSLAGDHTEVTRDLHMLLQLLGRLEFLLALGVLLAALTFCLGFMRSRRGRIEEMARLRPLNPCLGHVLLPAVVAAGMGCLMNIVLKALSELVRSAAAPECCLCLLGVVVFALGQVNFMNRGFALYQQTVFMPVYTALLVLGNTTYGLIFYQEYAALLQTRARCGLFLAGVLLVTAGVALLSRRRPPSGEASCQTSRASSFLELEDAGSSATPSACTPS